ncbi:MAG: glycosyltransferase family 39 protein, partial [bacterium]|nr:glycosyltransferase family 39 protein [bacterium]
MSQDKKEKILVLLGCLALVFLIYGRTLAGGFVFDDRSLVEYKDTLKIEKWEQVARMPYWTETAGLYRPVTLLSYAANFSLLGESPLGFHLVNLLLYAFSCYLLYALARRLFSDRVLAFSAAALFLVLPIHSEVVANIIGRAELLALFFSLLLFLELLKDQPQSWKMVIWAFAGMGSKETAVAAIPIAFVILLIAAGKTFKIGLARIRQVRHELGRAKPDHREPGEAEDSAEGNVPLRRGRTGGFNEEIGQTGESVPPARSGFARPGAASAQVLKRSFGEYVETASAILVGVGAYFFARLFVLGSFLPRVETSLVENPLMFAPFLNRIATALQVLTMYLQKSFWPFGLCSDYSYNQIPIAGSF